MRDQLIIRLTANAPEQVSWVRLTETNPNPIVESGQLEEAAAFMVGAQVIVLVPANDVLLSEASVPTKNKQRLLKALPYAMEEELAADVEELHFAIGKSTASGQISVAVIEIEMMDHWQRLLKTAGITPDIVTTELVAVPEEDDTWSIVLDDSVAFVRGLSISDFVVDIDNLGVVISLLLKEQAEALPTRIRVWCDEKNREVITELEATLKTVSENAETRDAKSNAKSAEDSAVNSAANSSLIKIETDFTGSHLDKGLIGLIANQGLLLNLDLSINLLQGNYSRREQLGKLWRPWRYAASLAGLLFVLQLGLSITESSQLERQYDDLKAEAKTIFRDTFPKAKRIVNVKVQMQQKLTELRGAGSVKKIDFLNLLADTGMAFKQTSGLVLKSIRYKRGSLDVEIEVPSLQILDQLKQKIAQKKGLEVEIQSAASRNNIVQGRLKIKGSAS